MKYTFLLAMVAAPNWTLETRYYACMGIHGAFLNGCTESYKGKNLSDSDINKIVSSCNDKAISFSKKLDICKDFEFTK